MSNPNIPVAVCVCPNYGKKTFDDADGPFISTSREAMPLLLEVARLMSKGHAAPTRCGPGLCEECNRLDSLLRKLNKEENG
jgi:hypothetical protein